MFGQQAAFRYQISGKLVLGRGVVLTIASKRMLIMRVRNPTTQSSGRTSPCNLHASFDKVTHSLKTSAKSEGFSVLCVVEG